MAPPVIPVGGAPVPMMGGVPAAFQDERLPGETNEAYIARLRSLVRVQSAEVGRPVPASGGDPAAMAEFERLLMATSRVTIRGRHLVQRTWHAQPLAVARLDLDLDGIGNGALSLVVNIDPESKQRTPHRHEPRDGRNTPPVLAFRTELMLQDGRSVMTLVHPGVSGDYRAQRIEVQVMDRDGPVIISGDQLKGVCPWCCCHPLVETHKTRAARPHSEDETLRHGYEESAPAALNRDTMVFMAFAWIIFCSPCQPLLYCIIQRPDVHYELRELHGGKVVDGVRYTQKVRRCCPYCGVHPTAYLPNGDTIAFAGSTPLPTRKDMVLMAAYRASQWAVWPAEYHTA